VIRGWVVPRLWQGQTVGVLASGSSMTAAAADAVRAAGVPAIAINTTFRLAPWAAMLYAADAAWWQQTPGAMAFAGLKVTMEDVRGVHRIGRAGTVGYTDDTAVLHTYSNSGAQAIQVAAKAGARRILLLGMDMQGGHWHGEHPKPLRNTEPELYAIWRGRFPVLAEALAARGVEVLNCSPDSALECWPKVSLEDALARAEHAG
jgi:hypothetical protein